MNDDLNLILNRGWRIALGTTLRPSWSLIKNRIAQRLLSYPFTAPNGYIIENRHQLMAYWDLVVEHGPFQTWPKLMPEAPVIFDIGANHGVFGWECRGRWPKATIYAFEPNPEWADKCHRLGVYNSIHKVALWSTKGKGHLRITDRWGSGSLAESGYKMQAETDRVIEVPWMPLDELDNIGVPDFIKCDVDGAEAHVVQGGLGAFSACKAALIETFDEGIARAIAKKTGKRFIRRQDYLFVNEKNQRRAETPRRTENQ